MAHVRMTENDVVMILRQANDEEVQKFAKDAGVVASLVKIFNGSLEIAEKSNGTKAGIALAFAQKTLDTSILIEKAGDSTALKTANNVLSIAISNKAFQFKDITKVSPTRLLTTAGLVTVNKMLILGGMQNQHKCKLALGSLAATIGLTWAAAPTGIGLVIGVIGVLADGVEAYGQCKPEIESMFAD